MPTFLNPQTGQVIRRDSEILPNGEDQAIAKARAEGLVRAWEVVNPKTGERHVLVRGVKEALDKGYVLPEQLEAQRMPVKEYEPGRVASFGLGAAQGMTAGFADEIGGALATPFRMGLNALQGKEVQGPIDTYKSERDKIRGATDQARADHGGYTFAGEVLGGAVLPAGAGLTKSAGLAQAIRRGAAVGAAQGGAGAVGESRDVTNLPELGKQVAVGVGVGGALGGAMGGIAKGASALWNVVRSGGVKGNPLSTDFLTKNPALAEMWAYLKSEPRLKMAASGGMGKPPEDIGEAELAAYIIKELQTEGATPFKQALVEVITTSQPGYNQAPQVLEAMALGSPKRIAARDFNPPEQLATARDVAAKVTGAEENLTGARAKARNRLERQAQRQFERGLGEEYQGGGDWTPDYTVEGAMTPQGRGPVERIPEPPRRVTETRVGLEPEPGRPGERVTRYQEGVGPERSFEMDPITGEPRPRPKLGPSEIGETIDVPGEPPRARTTRTTTEREIPGEGFLERPTGELPRPSIPGDRPKWMTPEFEGRIYDTIEDMRAFGRRISTVEKGKLSIIPEKDRHRVAIALDIIENGADVHGAEELGLMRGSLDQVPFSEWYRRMQQAREFLDEAVDYFKTNKMTKAASIVHKYRKKISRTLQAVPAKRKSDKLWEGYERNVTPALEALKETPRGAETFVSPAKVKGQFGERPTAIRTADQVAAAEDWLGKVDFGQDRGKIQEAIGAYKTARETMANRNLLESLGRAGGPSARSVEGLGVQGQLSDLVKSPSNFLNMIDEQFRAAQRGPTPLNPQDQAAFGKFRALMRTQLAKPAAQRTVKTVEDMAKAATVTGLSAAGLRALFRAWAEGE